MSKPYIKIQLISITKQNKIIAMKAVMDNTDDDDDQQQQLSYNNKQISKIITWRQMKPCKAQMHTACLQTHLHFPVQKIIHFHMTFFSALSFAFTRSRRASCCVTQCNPGIPAACRKITLLDSVTILCLSFRLVVFGCFWPSLSVR